MTGATTVYTIANAPYGYGSYVASASSSVSGQHPPWKAFLSLNYPSVDYVFWSTALNYNTNTGVYSGVTTTVFGATTYSGDWLQIQLPTPIILDSYIIKPRTEYPSNLEFRRSPRTFVVLGSNDGTTWDLIDNRVNITNWTLDSKQWYANSRNAYSFFRIVVNRVGNFDFDSSQTTANFGMAYYGFQDGFDNSAYFSKSQIVKSSLVCLFYV